MTTACTEAAHEPNFKHAAIVISKMLACCAQEGHGSEHVEELPRSFRRYGMGRSSSIVGSKTRRENAPNIRYVVVTRAEPNSQVGEHEAKVGLVHPGCHMPDRRYGDARLLHCKRQSGEQGRADGKRHVDQGGERNGDPMAVKGGVEPRNDGIERPSALLGDRIAGTRNHQHAQQRREQVGRGWTGAINGTAQ